MACGHVSGILLAGVHRKSASAEIQRLNEYLLTPAGVILGELVLGGTGGGNPLPTFELELDWESAAGGGVGVGVAVVGGVCLG